MTHRRRARSRSAAFRCCTFAAEVDGRGNTRHARKAEVDAGLL
jgi:hypothetical protein